MSGLVFAIVVVVFVVVAVLIVRRTQRGAIVERLPLEAGEEVLLEEERAKVFHRSRRTARFGRSGTITSRVRIVLTNRRILVASGGPEGRHKYVIQLILDYWSPAPAVGDSGYSAYLHKFRLENGYPTYPFTRDDVSFVEEHGRTGVRILVPFPEGGSGWSDSPEVVLYTSHPEQYRERFSPAS
jgi:hypothetical protein